MTQAFHGADPGALRAQALSLHEAAQTLTTCAQRTGAALDALAWQGADAARTRDAWRTGHARTLLTCAVAMQEAARRLLDEADTQEAASGGAGTAGAGDSAIAWDGVRAFLDRAHDVTSTALDRIGAVATTADAHLLAQAAGRWENVASGASLRTLDHGLSVMQEAHIGPAVGGVLQGAAALGVASDAYGAYRAHGAGDLHGTVDGGVSAVLGAGGFVPGLAVASTALGVSWDAGTAIGTAANDAMQGTDFHDRFTERMDAAFDVGGAWGVLNTPGALLVTGAEEVALQARDVLAGGAGTDDGTPDGRR
ncbi:hypothetical protein [Cellulomonas sp. S1-8]|uniref:hypothetical protein n=1 Tax=Cellulomonas sp. S1-8 TaxID=2904790 RepID=UPI002244BB20|nr:hypothetical protein [Cellulomonas sp. S1-8]UZN04540.1 hypothetical protein OKX07_06395 [Cellulomonas sp. S1-8]